MNNETILTFVGIDCSDEAIKDAITMAEAANAHLSLVIVAVAPQIYSYAAVSAHGGYVDVDHWTREVKEVGDALDKRANEIEKLVQSANMSADVLTEYSEIPLMKAAIVRYANVADRTVLFEGNGIAGDVEDVIISGIIFESPIALTKGSLKDLMQTVNHALIAWDSSNHASAAVHNALNMLSAAKDVTIAIFDPVRNEVEDGEEPGADIAAWLSRHGCNVTVEQYPSGGKEIGDCILDRAAEKGADLIVMGAYGHMKLKQQIFGGTTQTMLHQNKIPILAAHK